MASSERVLAEQVEWQRFEIESDAFHKTVGLVVGKIGDGRPVSVLSAGVHGDEGPWGALAIQKFLAAVESRDLIGTVRVVLAANPVAEQQDAREASLDLVNLNAAFPGDPAGTYTARLASVVASNVLAGSDVVIDVHGGGSWNVNCFVYEIDGSAALAEAFGASLIASALPTTSSLAGYAQTLGAQALWVEMGGKGSGEQERAAEVAFGIERALVSTGVLAQRPVVGVPGAARRSMGKTRLESSGAGFYVPVLRETDLGQLVGSGVVVGTLRDGVTGTVVEEYRTPYERSFVALLRPTVAVLDGPGQVVAVIHEVAG